MLFRKCYTEDMETMEEKHNRILGHKRKWRENNREKDRASKLRYAHSEKGKKKQQEYYRSHKDEFYRRAKISREKHSMERRAHEAVQRGLSSGKIMRNPCEVCGNTKADAHHDDYNKPLEVRWLCRTHHAEWHRKHTPIRATSKKICLICNKEFTYKHGNQKICSPKCRKQAAHDRYMAKKLCLGNFVEDSYIREEGIEDGQRRM